jgi:nitrile hydratase subunit beta
MNGVHDLGGMDGFTLPERDQGFALHEEWERELWGVVFALRVRGVPGFRLASPSEVVESLASDTSELIDADVAPRFALGDRVTARNEHPEGHTRMPRYVRGHTGTIVTLHGPHRFQDALPAGVELGPQHLYTVAFSARALWGSRGHVNDTIHVELWDYHLEAA